MELAQYLHACCCYSPVPSIFVKAIKNGNFISWPGLDACSILKLLPPSISTNKGNLKQEQKKLQCTKVIIKIENVDDNFFPSPFSPPTPTHDCWVIITSFNTTQKAYTDLTARFPST